MSLNLWSVLLIASASQCLFLIVFLLSQPRANRTARGLLIGLLGLLLLMNLGNFWYASRLYMEYPLLAGFTRGTTLLVGPLFYLYTLAVIRPTFRLRWYHLGHLSGYLLGWFLISQQRSATTTDAAMELVAAFLMNGLPMTPLVALRFTIYGVHLLAYLWAARQVFRSGSQAAEADFRISHSSRRTWLQGLTVLLIGAAAFTVGSLIHGLITQYYSVITNYINTLIYSVFIYVIAFQAFRDHRRLTPDFQKRYTGPAKSQRAASDWIEELEKLARENQIHRQPDLKLAEVAQHLGIPPHQLTALLNRELGHSFFDWVNQHRVATFCLFAQDPAFSHLSIMGLAEEAGFKSKSSFNTAFKKWKGTTPSAYLKEITGDKS
ncbi:MAG: AraC family transcriptional regulator [Bacteroidota bacterium]